VVLGESPELKSQYRKKKYTHRAGEQVLGSVPSTKKQTKNPQVITIKAIGGKKPLYSTHFIPSGYHISCFFLFFPAKP
jgi:hypothetical protein